MESEDGGEFDCDGEESFGAGGVDVGGEVAGGTGADGGFVGGSGGGGGVEDGGLGGGKIGLIADIVECAEGDGEDEFQADLSVLVLLVDGDGVDVEAQTGERDGDDAGGGVVGGFVATEIVWGGFGGDALGVWKTRPAMS